MMLFWNKNDNSASSVMIKDCVFKSNNANFRIQRYSENVKSHLLIENCEFYRPLYIFDQTVYGHFWGTMVIQGCVFHDASAYAIKIHDAKGQKIIKDCTFYDWNTDETVPTSDEEHSDVAAISLGSFPDNTLIEGCSFQKNKRRVGCYSSAGYDNVIVSNCTGGGDIRFTLNNGKNYAHGNLNHSNTLTNINTTGTNFDITTGLSY